MSGPEFAAIDSVFRLVDRVAWIVTAIHEDRRSGLVATWVNQCSIDPQAPLALIGLAPNHFTTELVIASKSFCLHLIDSSQLDLVWRFGLSSGRATDKFAGLSTTTAVTDSPVLAGCLAWLDCRVVTLYDAGDRIYFWADVVAGRQEKTGRPVTESEILSRATDEQKAGLRAGMLTDRVLHRPLREAWRQRVGAPSAV
jgi:flavin reductase (DIM6/NTAB) family NADH-FMN oxidoreductase RutF